MRRLPVYLLLDVSGSMFGEAIEAVNNGLKTMQSALRKDPNALEQAFISLIIFGGGVKQILPPTEVIKFQPPDLSASGDTPLGEALSLLAQCVEKEVVKATFEQKGDWRPLVFIMTDGEPTDRPEVFEQGLAAFNKIKWGNKVACAAGTYANTTVLHRIAEIVVRLDETDSNSIHSYFKWVSASVSAVSKSVGGGAENGDISALPPPPPEISLVTP